MYLKDSPEVQELMVKCFMSTKMSAKVFLPDRFDRPFCSLHDAIFELLDNSQAQKVVIAAPRGWGKTSTVNLAYPLKKILFQEKKFIVPISCTATQAQMQSENLKRELLSNNVLSDLFGPMKSENFSKDLWVTSTGIMVMPRGAGQQVRGILYGKERPDLIVIDDLEDSEGVKNPDQRAKLKEWFFGDVVNSVNRSKDDWKIVMIGTVLHEDSLLVNLLEDPTWLSIKIELCDENYRSNWPDYMTDEKVRDLAESYAKQGLLHVFAMEYRNSVIPADAPFQQKYFQRYKESNLDQAIKNRLENVVIYDPAKSTNPTSDFSAIVCLGLDTTGNHIYVREIFNERCHPDDGIRAAFDMVQKYRATALGYEVTGLDEFISYPIKTMASRHGVQCELVELRARGGRNAKSKEERVRALIPFYRQGMILHNDFFASMLESQLISYPRSKFWDVMDAVSYGVEFFEIGSRYFDVNKELLPDDYEEFDYESIGDWRIA